MDLDTAVGARADGAHEAGQTENPTPKSHQIPTKAVRTPRSQPRRKRKRHSPRDGGVQ